MDYKLIYNKIIEKALSNNRVKYNGVYYEKHHIIPKCLGGSNEKVNLVLLTAKEHFICHRLLCEIYPDNDKLKYALWRMTTNKGLRITSSFFERIKTEMANAVSRQHTKVVRSEEWKRKQRESKLGKAPSNKGKKLEEVVGKKRANEIKKKISTNTERSNKISKALKGRTFSEEHLLNLRKPKQK